MNLIIKQKVKTQKKLAEEAGSVSNYLLLMRECARKIEKKYKIVRIENGGKGFLTEAQRHGGGRD